MGITAMRALQASLLVLVSVAAAIHEAETILKVATPAGQSVEDPLGGTKGELTGQHNDPMADERADVGERLAAAPGGRRRKKPSPDLSAKKKIAIEEVDS